MKNLQKGFAIPIVIAVVAILVIGGGTYVYTNNKVEAPVSIPDIVDNVPATTTVNSIDKVPANSVQPVACTMDAMQCADGSYVGRSGPNCEFVCPKEPQGASYVPEKDRIKVLTPTSGEKVTIGNTTVIKWNNYSGNQNLTIALQITKPNGQVEAKNIATNVPNTGQFNWKVSSEDVNNKYRIEIHPYGDRTRVDRSDTFSIVGDSVIKNVSPESNSRVDASKPIQITGSAKNIYNEAEFNVVASYILDGEKKIIKTTYATCSLGGDGCDWTSATFHNFRATIDLSSSPVCSVNIDFLQKNEKDNSPESKPFYSLSLWLDGINDCQ